MSDDEDEVHAVVSFPDLDAAIAHALADVGEGGVVAVHDVDCKLTEDDEDTCTCEPLELVVGAKA